MKSKWNIKLNDVYLSPGEVFEEIERLFGLNLRNAFDPCPFPESEHNGLEIPWQNPTYCNPPFSKAIQWIQKAICEADKGITTIMLLPWYVQYGNSACRHILPVEKFKRFTYNFVNPITGKVANMRHGCILIRIDNNGIH